MSTLPAFILAVTWHLVISDSRGFIPTVTDCALELVELGCECHTISGLVIMCKDLDLEHWPRFGDMGAVDVDMLDISGNAFDHIPSNAFGNLRISQLVMSNNRNMFKSSNVGNLFNEHQTSTLLSLDLRDNGFETIPSFIDNLTSLRTLNLVGNDIATLPNSMIASAPDLTELRLGHVTVIENEAFASMSDLRVLEISPYPTRLMTLEQFFGTSNVDYIQNLQTLIIHGSRRMRRLNFVWFLPSLVYLEIVNSSLTDISPYTYDHQSPETSQLETINFAQNGLTVVPRSVLIPLDKLRSADFSYNAITTVNYIDFWLNPNLRFINLSHNRIAYVDSHAFSNLASLEVLDLSYNRLQVLSENSIPRSRGNFVVYLESNELKCNCDTYWMVIYTGIIHYGGTGPFDPYEVEHELKCNWEPGLPPMYSLFWDLEYCD